MSAPIRPAPLRPRRAAGAGLLALGIVFGGAARAGDLVPVPSGQEVRFVEAIRGIPGPEGLTVRFRFLAPGIARDGGSVDFDTAAADMEALCNSYALPRSLGITGPRPGQIVISLSDIPVPFGMAAPEATQFFEGYAIDGDRCLWEPW
ncbi:MAG: DUF6497 family protein [Gemmobacter sp.]